MDFQFWFFINKNVMLSKSKFDQKCEPAATASLSLHTAHRIPTQRSHSAPSHCHTSYWFVFPDWHSENKFFCKKIIIEIPVWKYLSASARH